MNIGVISDTHGLMRPEALQLLSGCERILHAGDVGTADVLESLRRIAPVTAVRGNTDHGALAQSLSPTEALEFHGVFFYILHDLARLDLDPVSAGFHVVITGHSHKPVILRDRGVLYVNPGSAGPKRFDLPVTVAKLTLRNGRIQARILPMTPSHSEDLLIASI